MLIGILISAQSNQEESLIQVVRVCRGGHGRLCAHALRPFWGMVSQIGGSWGAGGAHKMHVDDGKIRVDPTAGAQCPRADPRRG